MDRVIILLSVLVACLALAQGLQKCKDTDSLHCLKENAGCVNEKCVCDEGFTGDPYIACIPDNSTFCTILNDPRGFTFAGQPLIKGIDIPLPCKYKAAEFITETTTNPLPTKCAVEIFTAEQRYMGKFYVSGFELVLKYTNFPGTRGRLRGRYSFRVNATLANRQLEYNLMTRPALNGDYSDSSDLADLQLHGTNVFGYDSINRRFQLLLPGCGLALYFRPADSRFGLHQRARPGLLIGVDEGQQNVTYNDLLGTFCMSSNPLDRSVADVDELYKLDSDEAFTLKALVNRVKQDFPNVDTHTCRLASKTAQEKCTDVDQRAIGMQECFFILSEPNFVNCYSGEDENPIDSSLIMDLFYTCLKAYCTRDAGLCQDAQAYIFDSECGHHAKSTMVGFNCDYYPAPTAS